MDCHMGADSFFSAVQTCLTYIDRSNVSYGALQFRGDLHLNDAEYGLGAGT